MRGASGDYDRLGALLAERGAQLPSVPDSLRRQLKERDEWYFSTRSFKAVPADLMHYVRKAISGALPDFALIACTEGEGPGPAFQYYVVHAPLQLFLQMRWEAREASMRALNQALVLCEQLVAAVPPALGRGRLSPDGRLTVVASSTERGMQPSRRAGRRSKAPAPQQILSEALAWCRSK